MAQKGVHVHVHDMAIISRDRRKTDRCTMHQWCEGDVCLLSEVMVLHRAGEQDARLHGSKAALCIQSKIQ